MCVLPRRIEQFSGSVRVMPAGSSPACVESRTLLAAGCFMYLLLLLQQQQQRPAPVFCPHGSAWFGIVVLAGVGSTPVLRHDAPRFLFSST